MIGIGGSTIKEELAAITPIVNFVKPIQKEEFQQRIDKACQLMCPHCTCILVKTCFILQG